jgi:hypothetical protein
VGFHTKARGRVSMCGKCSLVVTSKLTSSEATNDHKSSEEQ